MWSMNWIPLYEFCSLTLFFCRKHFWQVVSQILCSLSVFLSSSTLFPVQLQTFWKCENWYQARSVFKCSGLHWATLICMDLFLVSNVYVCVSLSRNTELISSAIKAKGSRQAPIATSSPTSLFCRRNWNWEVEYRSERRKISSIWVLTDRYLCTRACVDVLLLQ